MSKGFEKKTVKHSFKELRCLPELLEDWWLDIKTCKVGCKNCVDGLMVANAGSQSRSLRSSPLGGESFVKFADTVL